ncbi:MAG: diaminopimelate epimerase [Firmicutes bacterium]|nr:diaminopimelate epimerase [Bacillota bacterium]
MELEFWKLEGLGNDYLYFDVRDPWPVTPNWNELARRLSDRHFGVGADGIITIAQGQGVDAVMRIFNADGSESEMCGNGLRGMAKWLYDRGLAGTHQTIRTGAGLRFPEVVESVEGRAELLRINMGVPRFEVLPGGSSDIAAGGLRFPAYSVSMGNPHLVIFGTLWDREQMARWGPLLERHEWFPRRINVHSAEVVGRHGVKMRHWERGAGQTLACGTGAAGAAALALRLRLVESPLAVEVPGGVLTVEWDRDESHPVYLTGPAREVFHGYCSWVDSE